MNAAAPTNIGPARPVRRWLRWIGAAGAVGAFFAALFIYNGTNTGWRVPDAGVTSVPATTNQFRELRVLTWNIAKCDVYQGRFRFRSTDAVRTHLDQVAAVIRAEHPDLVSLTEINLECAPCPVNQVEHLTRALAMHAWAFGENNSFGLPFCRIRTGNALLSRLPLRALETQQLVGGTPFYYPRNNRRLLWAELTVNGHPLLAAGLRNDSFNPENNLLQVEQILRKLDGKPALLAGDFNVSPEQAAMKRWRSSGLFTAAWDGPATFPSEAPTERIDNILAPAGWKLVSSKVLKSDFSDHLPMVSVFALPDSKSP